MRNTIEEEGCSKTQTPPLAAISCISRNVLQDKQLTCIHTDESMYTPMAYIYIHAYICNEIIGYDLNMLYIYKLYIYIIYTLVLAQRVWSHNQGSLQQDSFLLSLTVQSNPPQEGKSVDGLSHVISSQRMNIRAQKPPPTSHLCPAKLQP